MHAIQVIEHADAYARAAFLREWRELTDKYLVIESFRRDQCTRYQLDAWNWTDNPSDAQLFTRRDAAKRARKLNQFFGRFCWGREFSHGIRRASLLVNNTLSNQPLIEGTTQMSTLKVSASPVEFKDGFMSVKLSLLAKSDLYAKTADVRNVQDVAAEVNEARKALAGKDAYISITITHGRKPNGFDAWYSANRKLFTIKAEEEIK